MPDDRPIAPSPARLALAQQAGLRAPARWFAAGLGAVLASRLVEAVDLRALGQALQLGRVSPATVGAALRQGLSWWGTMASVALGAAVVARALSGGLGPIDRSAHARLGVARVVPGAWFVIVASVVSLAVMCAMLLGVLAGAARGADVPATSGALQALWVASAAQTLALAGALACAVGLVELVLWRSARHRALHQTVQDARRQARDNSRKST